MNYTVKLAVLGEPPKILSDLQATVLYEGENLTILCQVRGVPLPSLVWYFNDSPISGRPSVSFYMFSFLKRTQVPSWVRYPKEMIGYFVLQTFLSIIIMMKLFSFKVKSITTGNEKLRESQIEIAQVTKKDEGIYKCEASNTYGSGVTRMAKVTVVERTTVKVILLKSY